MCVYRRRWQGAQYCTHGSQAHPRLTPCPNGLAPDSPAVAASCATQRPAEKLPKPTATTGATGWNTFEHTQQASLVINMILGLYQHVGLDCACCCPGYKTPSVLFEERTCRHTAVSIRLALKCRVCTPATDSPSARLQSQQLAYHQVAFFQPAGTGGPGDRGEVGDSSAETRQSRLLHKGAHC